MLQVMMKDVADSKRLYNAIRTHPSVITSQGRRDRQQAAPSIGPVTALIISELFWPTLQPENLALHPEVGPRAAGSVLFPPVLIQHILWHCAMTSRVVAMQMPGERQSRHMALPSGSFLKGLSCDT